jgi:cobalt transporter subunit CbtB
MSRYLNENHVAAIAEYPGSNVLVQDVVIGSKWPALFAAVLGGVMIFGVGFSDLSVSHNAAHDTRHAMVFPCH